jgi:LPXTG-site transpeptidase (sortase) family protein
MRSAGLLLLLAAAAWILGAGIGLLAGTSLRDDSRPTPTVRPRVVAVTPTATPTTQANPVQDSSVVSPPREPIPITRIRIPAIGVDAPVVVKGLDSERRMEAPDHPDEIAWYDFTALPGQGSNVVLAGHVDFAGVGPAVFWDLWRVRVGDLVELGLADGRVSRYRVTGLETVEERQAPVERIVGPTGQERLTLITCAGSYNPATGRYDQRLIVTATPLANP